MYRNEPTMPKNATLQKIALATGDFKGMYQAPVMQAAKEQTDDKRDLTQAIQFLQWIFKADDLTLFKVGALIKKEKDLELDENNYLLNPFFPIAYKAV